MASGRIRIGISGWRYAPWRGAFYPEGLVQRRELAYAAQAFPTIEINGSFYSLQDPSSWGAWADDTPDDFVFGVKGARFITHMKRLRDIEAPLANFFASGVLRLGAKLGPVLWQFPPNFRFEPERLETFLARLPRDTAAALETARGHDHRVADRTWLAIDAVRPIRHAVEVRHPSFLDPAFVALLRRQKVAFVVADTAGQWIERDDVTADFVYVRLHGSETLYQSAYSDAELDRWAARIRAWSTGGDAPEPRLIGARRAPARRGRDVYCYFDNTDKLQAPLDAKRLMARLGLDAPAGTCTGPESMRGMAPAPSSLRARRPAPPR